MNELEALVALTSIPYLGPVKMKVMLETFGSALECLNADPKLIEEMRGFGTKIAAGFKTWGHDKSWQDNLTLVKKYGVRIISYKSPEYPKDLLKLNDFPILLYVLGDLNAQDNMSLAVIGTRQASIYGLEAASKISEDLAAQGFTIVSGLARGIDTAAHHAALKKGRTIAVIGSGLADIYPKENLRLVELIAKNGAVISEFPMMTPPERQNFPRRNRIVSGMTKGSILIEAPIKSGAMITMEMALSQNKKLFAIPGRIDNENFQGNHLLIKRRHAELVENAADIWKSFESFEFQAPLKNQDFPVKSLFSMEEEELLAKLPTIEFSMEELTQLINWPAQKLNVLLMSLMLKRAIKEYPGKIYKKISRG